MGGVPIRGILALFPKAIDILGSPHLRDLMTYTGVQVQGQVPAVALSHRGRHRSSGECIQGHTAKSQSGSGIQASTPVSVLLDHPWPPASWARPECVGLGEPVKRGAGKRGQSPPSRKESTLQLIGSECFF